MFDHNYIYPLRPDGHTTKTTVTVPVAVTVEPAVYYNGHPWDHAKSLLKRDGLHLLIEVGGALELY